MNHIQLKIFTQPISETSEEEGNTFKLSFQESEPGPPHKVIFTTTTTFISPCTYTPILLNREKKVIIFFFVLDKAWS